MTNSNNGFFGKFGGRFVPEELEKILIELEKAFSYYINDKDFLNEFEADRAALPGVEKETLAKLRNKTIVISGGELARCLCYAFLYNNEAKRLGIKVILLGKWHPTTANSC